jgi:hypothetical protein
MPHSLGNIAAWWNRLWFTPTATHTLDLFRIVFGVLHIVVFIGYWPNWQRFYGADATWPFETFMANANPQISLFMLSGNLYFIWSIYWLGLAAALAFTLGIRTRLATFVLYLVSLSALYRDANWGTGHEAITMPLLFFCLCAPLGIHFSWDAWRRGSRNSQPAASIWAWRMMQLTVMLIYFFAGLSKLVDSEVWRQGTALYYLSFSDRWIRFQHPLLHHPILTALATYTTLMLELGFTWLILWRRIRHYFIAVMLVFHTIIVFIMTPSVMLVNIAIMTGLLLFMNPYIIKNFARRLTPGSDMLRSKT